ncbi:MAG TPA: VanZ family protein [Gemmatimonadales bacterium]|nr:VanZ family protein [Gemmatimonadales bacterium]
MNSGQSRRGWRAVTALALAGIAVVTLSPRPEQAETVALTPFWCLLCGDLGAVDVLLNVALFVPLGFGLRRAGRPVRQVGLLALGTSLTVELLQILVPGRDPSLSDLITNTAGGVMGGLLAEWVPLFLAPAPPLAGFLAAGWAVVWLIQSLLTAAIVTPALPPDWFWGQLAPDLAQFERFRGRVVSASAGPYPIRIRRLTATEAIRRGLLSGDPLVGVTTPGDHTIGLAPIVSIFDQHHREIALLGRWGDDLVYRLRTRAFDALLRPPAIRLTGAFGGRDSSLVGVAGRYDPSGATFVVALEANGTRAERRVPLSAQWGWMLLVPFAYAYGPEGPIATAVWIFGWMVPLGFWGWRSGRLGAAAGLGLLALGLGVVPRVFGLQGAAGGEWLAALAGFGLGALAGVSRPAPAALLRRRTA